jgi:hypothetical protein
MQVLFDMGQDLANAVSGFDRASRDLRTHVSRGLALGIDAVASQVQADYLTGQYLKARTGNLRRAVRAWMAADLDGVIGVSEASAVDRYKWLLGDNPQNQPMVIRPKKGKYLTIPIPGEALTGSGVLKAKYSGGLRSIEGGFFFQSGGQLLFGIKKGKTKRAKVYVLFVLKREVEVYDTGALPDGVLENVHRVTDAINEQIGDLL